MSIAFLCGAETPTEFAYPNWDVLNPNSGAVTVDTAHVRSGVSAIKITSDANLQQEIAAGKQVFVMRLAVWVPSTESVLTRLVETYDNGVQRLLSWNPATGKLQWFDGTVSTLALPLDQWNTVDLLIDSRANPHLAAWRVNEVAQATPAPYADAASDFPRFFIGSGNASSGARWIDDLAVSFTAADYPIGDGQALWNGSAEVWTIASTASFAHAAASWDASAVYVEPPMDGPRGGAFIMGPAVVRETRKPKQKVKASAKFAQAPASWAAVMQYNDDELVLEMLAGAR